MPVNALVRNSSIYPLGICIFKNLLGILKHGCGRATGAQSSPGRI